MGNIRHTNNASGTLASGITNVATTITLGAGQGALFPTVSGSQYAKLTIENSLGNIEIVHLTGKAGDVLTVVRAQEGTTGFAFSSGARVENRVTAAVLDEFLQKSGDSFSGVLDGGGSAIIANVKLRGTSGTSSNELIVPTGGAAPTIGGSVILTVANFGGTSALYPQSAAELAKSVTPSRLIYTWGVFPRYNTTGDGVAVDTTGVANAIKQAEGSTRIAAGLAGESYKIDASLVPTGKFILDLTGATLKSTTSVDVLIPKSGLDVLFGTFDTYAHAIYNATTADPTMDLSIWGTEFLNGGNQGLNLECPIRDVKVLFPRHVGNKGYNQRIGQNTLALQSGWKSFLSLGGYFEDLDPVGANEVAPIISYAPGSRILAHYFRDIMGASGQDTAWVYTKSKYGLVGLFHGNGIDSAGTAQINAVNLKGDDRNAAGGTPAGFGATLFLSSLIGSGKGSGCQMESDEQGVIGCYFENFERAITGGSGPMGYSLVLGNRSHHLTGGSTTVGQSFNSINGKFVLNADGITRGYRSGVKYTVPTAKTLQGLSIYNQMIEGEGNTLGVGIDISAIDADSITLLSIADCTIKTFAQGIFLQNVNGAHLQNLLWADLQTASRPIFLSGCKNIRGVNVFSTTFQTTDASANNVFQLGDLANGNVLVVRMYASAAKSDMSAVGNLKREFIFKRTAGSTTLVATGAQTNDGGNTLPIDALSAAAVTDRGVFRVKGILAETWNWNIHFDFELL